VAEEKGTLTEILRTTLLKKQEMGKICSGNKNLLKVNKDTNSEAVLHNNGQTLKNYETFNKLKFFNKPK
jgi:hypothetical protein